MLRRFCSSLNDKKVGANNATHVAIVLAGKPVDKLKSVLFFKNCDVSAIDLLGIRSFLVCSSKTSKIG